MIQTYWEEQRGAMREGVTISFDANGNVDQVAVWSEGVNPLCGGGAASCSAREFLDGQIWDIIRSNLGDDVLQEVIASVRALVDRPREEYSPPSRSANYIARKDCQSCANLDEETAGWPPTFFELISGRVDENSEALLRCPACGTRYDFSPVSYRRQSG
jgi:hypothetical protein